MNNKYVLVSSDMNKNYLSFFPIVHLLWNKLIGIKVKLILINNIIPKYLEKYKDDIILFRPIKNMNTAFQAQCIRLLYPCLFKDDDIILISDIDILPINKSFFNIKVKDKFIIMRDAYQTQNMFGMCHNIAKSIIWRQVFKVYNEKDIILRLKDWYNKDYKINKVNQYWYTDQKKLFEYLSKYDNKIILKDKNTKYKSFDLKRIDNLIYFIEKPDKLLKNLNSYTNIHCNKPYYYLVYKLLKYLLPDNNLQELDLIKENYGNLTLDTFKKMRYKIMTYTWSSYMQRIENGLSKCQYNNYLSDKDYQVVILCKGFYYYKATLLSLLYNKIIGLNNLLVYTSERSHSKIEKITKSILSNYQIIKLKSFDNVFEQIETNFNKLLIVKPGFLILNPNKFKEELKNESYGEHCYILNKTTNKVPFNDKLCCQFKYTDNPYAIYNLDVNLDVDKFFKIIRSIKKNHKIIRRLL